MCFSATASFSAGVVLTASGIISVKSAKVPSYKPVASTPLIFAVHQITEGFLWLSLTKPAFFSWEEAISYLYLVIGQIAWPVFIPWAIYITEPRGNRKRLIFALLGLGILAAVLRSITLMAYGAEAEIQGQHIVFLIDRMQSYTVVGVAVYLITVIVPLLISRIKYLWIIGLLILFAFIFTSIAYMEARLSVWCFFAALISIGLVAIFSKLN